MGVPSSFILCHMTSLVLDPYLPRVNVGPPPRHVVGSPALFYNNIKKEMNKSDWRFRFICKSGWSSKKARALPQCQITPKFIWRFSLSTKGPCHFYSFFHFKFFICLFILKNFISVVLMWILLKFFTLFIIFSLKLIILIYK